LSGQATWPAWGLGRQTAFVAAWTTGHGLPLEDAIALALSKQALTRPPARCSVTAMDRLGTEERGRSPSFGFAAPGSQPRTFEGRLPRWEEGRRTQVAAILKAKGTHVETTRPDTSLYSVIWDLKLKRIGALVVSQDGSSVLGLVTERGTGSGRAWREAPGVTSLSGDDFTRDHLHAAG